MADLDKLVKDLTENVQRNAKKSVLLEEICAKVFTSGDDWIRIKQREFINNTDGLFSFEFMRYVKEKEIPFEALRLNRNEITNRNNIYTNIFLTNITNETTIMPFIENIYLFLDITNKDDIKNVINDLLNVIDNVENKKKTFDNIKKKINDYNLVRKQFNALSFVNKFVPHIPMVGMMFREHGRPYKSSNKEEIQLKSPRDTELVNKQIAQAFSKPSKTNTTEKTSEDEAGHIDWVKKREERKKEMSECFNRDSINKKSKDLVKFMAVREHGRPYGGPVFTMAVREHGRPFDCSIS